MSTWQFPATIAQVDALAAMLEQGPMTASSAIDLVADYIGGDTLFETIDMLCDVGEGDTDVRSLIVDFLRQEVDAFEDRVRRPYNVNGTIAKAMGARNSAFPGTPIETGLHDAITQLCDRLDTQLTSRINAAEVVRQYRQVQRTIALMDTLPGVPSSTIH